MNKLLVILGPTATGKTDLALRLAEKFNGELVACDSRQVYRGLDIGTGKMPGVDISRQSSAVRLKKRNGFWEINGIKIWMYDVADLKEQYSVADYVKDANRVIDEIVLRGKLPIVVGGSGLYIKALLEGLSNLSFPVDLNLRKELEKLSLRELQKKLQKISPQKWDKMNNSDQHNSRRLVRLIELASADFTLEESLSASLRTTVRGGLHTLKIGLTAPREIICQRINEKILEWVENGIVDEVSKLIEKGVNRKRFMELGLEYVVAVEYLERRISFDQMVEKMQNKVRQYAKRQITWFKKERNVCWFDIADRGCVNKVEELVNKWYDNEIKVTPN